MESLTKILTVSGKELKSLGFNYGFSTNFLRLKLYADDWTIEDILVYEYFLQYSNSNGKNTFKISQKKIMSDTRLSKTLIVNSVEKLKSKGILSVYREKKENLKRANVYTLNRLHIANNLEKIYSFKNMDADQIKTHKKKLETFVTRRNVITKKLSTQKFNPNETDAEKEKREENTLYDITEFDLLGVTSSPYPRVKATKDLPDPDVNK